MAPTTTKWWCAHSAVWPPSVRVPAHWPPADIAADLRVLCAVAAQRLQAGEGQWRRHTVSWWVSSSGFSYSRCRCTNAFSVAMETAKYCTAVAQLVAASLRLSYLLARLTLVSMSAQLTQMEAVKMVQRSSARCGCACSLHATYPYQRKQTRWILKIGFSNVSGDKSSSFTWNILTVSRWQILRSFYRTLSNASPFPSISVSTRLSGLQFEFLRCWKLHGL